MRDAEVHSELHGPQGQVSVGLVVIGHAGVSVVRTRTGRRESPGGSGYAVAASAAALIGSRVGLVAQVGPDFDLAPLRRLNVNLEGVIRLRGATARLCIDQLDDGSRTFSADLGVAADARLDSFPSSYLNASYIHLGTAPPQQQLEWLRFLRGRPCSAQISADMFEHYVATDRGNSREVCDHADLVLLNQQEYDGLYSSAETKPPRILKGGSRARACSRTVWYITWRPSRRRWWTPRAAARSSPGCSSRCGSTGDQSAMRWSTLSAPPPAASRIMA